MSRTAFQSYLVQQNSQSIYLLQSADENVNDVERDMKGNIDKSETDVLIEREVIRYTSKKHRWRKREEVQG